MQQPDAQHTAKLPAFVPLLVRDSEQSASIVTELRGGRLLPLPGSMPAARLTELVRALEVVEPALRSFPA